MVLEKAAELIITYIQLAKERKFEFELAMSDIEFINKANSAKTEDDLLKLEREIFKML